MQLNRFMENNELCWLSLMALPRPFHNDYYGRVNHVMYLGYCNKVYASIVGLLALSRGPTMLPWQRPLEKTFCPRDEPWLESLLQLSLFHYIGGSVGIIYSLRLIMWSSGGKHSVFQHCVGCNYGDISSEQWISNNVIFHKRTVEGSSHYRCNQALQAEWKVLCPDQLFRRKSSVTV
jgi:hypothetical protein